MFGEGIGIFVYNDSQSNREPGCDLYSYKTWFFCKKQQSYIPKTNQIQNNNDYGNSGK